MNEQVVLICAPLRFYTQNDESLCFKWIKKITCIKKIKGVGRELHLYIPSPAIPNSDLLELTGLFDRYRFDASQLKVFMNESNKDWFKN